MESKMDNLTKKHILSLHTELLAIVERMDSNYGYSSDKQGHLVREDDANRLKEITQTLNNIMPDRFQPIDFVKETAE